MSRKKSASSNHPIFCSSLDKEFPNLVATYIVAGNKGTQQQQQQKQQASSLEGNWNLQNIMRKYLVDFWRHHIEKEHGNNKLWEEITGMNPSISWWNENNYNNERNNTNNNDNSTMPKTRWQNIAEQLFCNLLQIKNFTPNHVSYLIDLRNKIMAKGDTELVEIIDNYLRTL